MDFKPTSINTQQPPSSISRPQYKNYVVVEGTWWPEKSEKLGKAEDRNGKEKSCGQKRSSTTAGKQPSTSTSRSLFGKYVEVKGTWWPEKLGKADDRNGKDKPKKSNKTAK